MIDTDFANQLMIKNLYEYIIKETNKYNQFGFDMINTNDQLAIFMAIWKYNETYGEENNKSNAKIVFNNKNENIDMNNKIEKEIQYKYQDIKEGNVNLTISNDSKNGSLVYVDLYKREYTEDINNIEKIENGYKITKTITDENNNLKTKFKVGDTVKVKLNVNFGDRKHYVAIEDYLPSTFEVVNTDLKTTSSQYEKQYVPYSEIRDDRVFYSVDDTYGYYSTRDYVYYAKVTHAGRFVVPGTVVYSMYNLSEIGTTKPFYIDVEK